MKARRHIVVLGTMGNVPFAGMAWMHGQFLVGLAKLNHDVLYAETTTAWPYHPLEYTPTSDPSYTLDYLARVMKGFGLQDRWAYRAAYADTTWLGPKGSQAEELIRSADAVLNITGSTAPDELGIPCRLIYVGTDPVLQELRIANGDSQLMERIAAHQAHFTYGENIGQPDCPVPPLPFPTTPTRQPVVIEQWTSPGARGPHFTTVTNWEVNGYDVTYQGERYTWSKHHQYLRILDLPKQIDASFELAMGLSGVSDTVRNMLRENGWKTVDAYQMSLDPWNYRDYICNSRGELSVAKDMVVRLRSGWFSERSACYLASGRPVVTQDTAFSKVLPTGEGLFAFETVDDIVQAIDAINTDYPRHCRAAYDIANEYFRAETVLNKLLMTIGL